MNTAGTASWRGFCVITSCEIARCRVACWSVYLYEMCGGHVHNNLHVWHMRLIDSSEDAGPSSYAAMLLSMLWAGNTAIHRQPLGGLHLPPPPQKKTVVGNVKIRKLVWDTIKFWSLGSEATVLFPYVGLHLGPRFLTPWSHALLEKPPIAKVLKNFPTF
jgi:hypothetical protein